MRVKKLFSIALSVLLVFVCMPYNASAEIIPDGAEYIEGEILISSTKEIEDSLGMLHTASDSDTVMIDFEDVGIESVEEVQIYTEEENLYVAEIDGDIEKICRELNKNSDIIAEPNYILHTADMVIRDSFYNSYEKWYYNDILQLPQAISDFNVTGEGVTIAVIDNGYYIDASDFPTNLWLNSGGTVGWNVHNNNDNISPIYKSNGETFNNTAHGSNVAGIIGMPKNTIGGIGVAYGAELMLIQAAQYVNDDTPSGFSSSDIAAAIDFAKENGADIINLSLGSASNSITIRSAVNRAYNAGVAVIAAAGNNGCPTSTSAFYPAALSNVIGVMAIDKTDPTQLASFSNYDTSGNATYYDIAAPGTEILGCGITTSGFTLNNGTSQASPIVAGCAALLLSLYPDYTVDDLYNVIRSFNAGTVLSNPTASTTTYQYRSLNAYSLLSFVEEAEYVVDDLNTSAFIDVTHNYFCGLNEGFEDIARYITPVEGKGSITFIPTENGNGTGSIIEIYNRFDILYKTIPVVVFGDINGDSYIDGQDAVLLKCKLNNMLELDTYQTYAADTDIDNGISSSDVQDMIDSGLKYIVISQLR